MCDDDCVGPSDRMSGCRPPGRESAETSGRSQPIEHGEQFLEQRIGAGFDLVEDIGETVQAVAGLAAGGNTPFVVVRIKIDLGVKPDVRVIVPVPRLA